MNPETVLDAWSELATPSDVWYFEASEASTDSQIWYACDQSGDYHLLILVPDGAELPTHTTKGLAASVRRHRIPGWGDGDCIDLSCNEDTTLNVFATVVCEIIKQLDGAQPEDRSAIVAEILERWRWFWGVESAGLSDREALGLFGELWFLDQWVGVTRESVLAWGGDDQSRHDFQWPEHSVEVKTTARRGDGAIVHTVQHLDQLAAPETGILYLFSLRVARDRLAANTLALLASRCSDQLQHAVEVRDVFLRKLSQRGYSPADTTLRTTTYRIVDEELYGVSGEFPRLEAGSFVGGLPNGVTEVSYKIDLSVCEPWRRSRESLTWLDRSTDPAS